MWAAIPVADRERAAGGRDGARVRGDPARGRSGDLLPARRGRSAVSSTVTVALCATAIVVIALLWEVMIPYFERRRDRRRARREARAAGEGLSAYDPGRERRAEQRARELLRSCVNEEEWEMYRDLGLIRVWGGESLDKELRGVPYAYLIYPHKPIVAYLPQTGRLLNEYCVEFPDESQALRQRAAARLRRRARQVDGAQGRRAAPDLERQHASARPPGRPAAGPARHLAPRALGARAPRAPSPRLQRRGVAAASARRRAAAAREARPAGAQGGGRGGVDSATCPPPGTVTSTSSIAHAHSPRDATARPRGRT